MLIGDLRVGRSWRVCERAGDSLARGIDVVVDIGRQHPPRAPSNPRSLRRWHDCSPPLRGTRVRWSATGGETAAALLSRLGVNGIRLVDEIEPGIPLGLTLGEVSVPVVTKAGAFGDEECLNASSRRLPLHQQKGFA